MIKNAVRTARRHPQKENITAMSKNTNIPPPPRRLILSDDYSFGNSSQYEDTDVSTTTVCSKLISYIIFEF